MGVLPAPPTTRLPTQITGMEIRLGRAKATRSEASMPTILPTGASKLESNERLLQNAGSGISLTPRQPC